MAQSPKWSVARRASSTRPDLSKFQLIVLATMSLALVVCAAVLAREGRSGDPLNQTSAIVGTVFLMMPLVFFLAKRMGFAANPPFWFVMHAVCGFVGIALIAVHVAPVSSVSPALVPLVSLVFLVCQGFWVRAFLTRRLSFLFARSPKSFAYTGKLPPNREAIAAVIKQKEELLKRLDPSASEATFSPRLRHWVRRPFKALRYDYLARKEGRLVGARGRAGLVLSYARQVHILVAGIFYLSLLAHVVVMLFFAGYAAKGGEAYWWHFASWGAQ